MPKRHRQALHIFNEVTNVNFFHKKLLHYKLN